MTFTVGDLSSDQPPPEIHLRRIDPARNMARFYALSVELTLFEDWSCTRQFGRIGSKGGRIMLGLYETKAEAEIAFRHLLRQKQTRGYGVASDTTGHQAGLANPQ
jgi:predicted DNA-binding WGR domain protein